MEKEIEKLLEVIYESYNNDLETSLVDALVSINPQIKPFRNELAEIVSRYLNFNKLKGGLIEIYKEYFDENEISAIYKFYTSDEGKKFIGHQTEIYAKTHQLSQELLAESKEEMDKEVFNLLKNQKL